MSVSRKNVDPKDYDNAVKGKSQESAYKNLVELVNSKYNLAPLPKRLRAKAYLKDFTLWDVTGPFGRVYKEFKGDPKGAFEKLVSTKDGDALGVYHRNGIGDIDLVYGDNEGGLAHIIDKHVGEGKSFENIEEAIDYITHIINEGNIESITLDKAKLSLGDKVVILRKNYRIDGRKKAVKNWILTAYDPHVGDDSSAIRDINQGQAAPPPSPGKRKGITNSSDVQAKSKKGAKFSLQGGRSIADKYEKRVDTKGKGGKMHISKFNAMEAMQDEMRALKEVQRIIEQEYGIVLESYEDAYMAENTMSSIAKASWDRYINEVFWCIKKV